MSDQPKKKGPARGKTPRRTGNKDFFGRSAWSISRDTVKGGGAGRSPGNPWKTASIFGGFMYKDDRRNTKPGEKRGTNRNDRRKGPQKNAGGSLWDWLHE